MQSIIHFLQKFPVYVLLLLSAFSTILADFFAKYWSTNQKIMFFIIALTGYLFSGLFYIPILLKEGLVITAVIWSLLNIIGFLFVGLVLFKETIAPIQIIGVALGIIALVVLSSTFK